MPAISEIIGNTITDDAFLAKMTRRHQARLLSSIGTLRDNITSLLSQLETTPAGRLKGVKVNLKQSQRLHKKIVNEFEKTYNKSVDTMLGDFSEIGQLVDRSYRHLGEAAKFTSIDKTIMTTLKNQTYDRYMEFGTTARDQIARSMYDSVIGGNKFSTLVNTVRGVLTGHKDVRGRSMAIYAKGFAQDAVMNFHNQVNVKKGEDLGMKHFLYYGDLITASRPFCITRAGKVYNKGQINSWNSMGWKGKSGPPMSERGGYNCRHHWRPVRPEWMQDEDGEPVSREEVVGYMNPASPGVSKTIKKIEAKQGQINVAVARMAELRETQKVFKAKKAAGDWSDKTKSAYAKLRIEINDKQKKIIADLKGELKELRDELKGQGKKIIKQAKKTTVVKAPKKAAKAPKKVEKLVEDVVTTFKASNGIDIIRHPGVSNKFFDSIVKNVELIPERMSADFILTRSKFRVGTNMSAINPKYIGKHPTGWSAGTTWDMVEGGYNFDDKMINLVQNTIDKSGYKTQVSMKRRIQTLFHEFGHGIDGGLSRKISFREAYIKDVANLSVDAKPGLSYYLQAGNIGREELYAEIISQTLSEKTIVHNVRAYFPNSAKVIDDYWKVGKKTEIPKLVDVIKYKEVDEVWADKLFNKWYNGLSSKEIDALAKYKSDHFGESFYKNVYEDINDHLRKGEKIKSENKKLISIIDKALKKGVIDKDIYLYRGISKNVAKTLENNIGKVITDKAFMSTTMYGSSASEFGNGLVIKIRVPKGTKGGFMGLPGIDLGFFNEGEILLPRGTKIRVLGKSTKMKLDKYSKWYTRVIDVEVVGKKVKKVAKLQPAPPMIEAVGSGKGYVRKDGIWFLKNKKVSVQKANELDKLKIPPEWTDVVVSTSPTAKIQAIGLDSAGRWQYRYSLEHTQKAARKKFDNVQIFKTDMPAINRKIKAGMKAGDDRAFLLQLENKTAIRIGTDADLKAKQKAYGLTTLQNEHVAVRGDKIILEFRAKKGIPVRYEVVDKTLAEWIKARKSVTKRGQKLFPDITAKKLNDYLKEISQKRYTIKDFRTYHGTRIAFMGLKKYAGKVIDASRKKRIIKEISEKVSKFLGNTPAMAKKAYIDPMVWDFIGGL